MIICLKGEIRYGGSSLPDAFRETAMHCSEGYAVFLKAVSEKMENRQEEDPGRIVRQCAMEYLRENVLSAEEKERIAQLGERLGYLDREMQLRQLSLYESEFERMIQKAKETAPAKKKVVRAYNRQVVFQAKTLQTDADIDDYVEKIRSQLKQLLRNCDEIKLN